MIPLVDLGAQYQEIKHDVEAAIHRVLESSRYVLGPAAHERTASDDEVDRPTPRSGARGLALGSVSCVMLAV